MKTPCKCYKVLCEQYHCVTHRKLLNVWYPWNALEMPFYFDRLRQSPSFSAQEVSIWCFVWHRYRDTFWQSEGFCRPKRVHFFEISNCNVWSTPVQRIPELKHVSKLVRFRFTMVWIVVMYTHLYTHVLLCTPWSSMTVPQSSICRVVILFSKLTQALFGLLSYSTRFPFVCNKWNIHQNQALIMNQHAAVCFIHATRSSWQCIHDFTLRWLFTLIDQWSFSKTFFILN